MEVKTIHESLVNGQRTQMVSQIEEYGLYDFFSEYRAYLKDFYTDYEGAIVEYFTDATISYFRIKNR